ncbi:MULTISPECIES: CsiV family protein [unclassified Legionella]|uniref:CsiV family protein n=1 Tax=unclassified Legionella TaxID=2622702 RepID=UPI00105612DA|nr:MULTISPECIES: CsiV family protein [unclassified Legionella]MDI9819106.1 CsiV family protein [Legionella sp. PL877]
MFKGLIFIIGSLLSCLLHGNGIPSFYQVDLIVFTHQDAGSLPGNLTTITPDTSHGIPLLPETSPALSPYHLRPSSTSQLKQQYWALNQKPQYHVLLHYTWVQPFNNQRAIILPKISRNGWQVEGTLRIRRSNYYLLDTDLLFSTPDSKASFTFNQKQRISGGKVYYLDHPQAGMLIKVHQLG